MEFKKAVNREEGRTITTEEIKRKLTHFIKTDPGNTLAAHGKMPIYDSDVLVGVASADDPLFLEFRKPGIVGPNFILPDEWLSGAKSVVSFFLPFTKAVRESNRAPGFPSEEWLSSRIDGEKFNNTVRKHLIEMLAGENAKAVSPPLDARYQVVDRISNWSERHAAYAAGLGTFGLHKALITEKGTTGRFGSVICDKALAPTKRGYTSYVEYCPYLTQGKCGACIPRCPVGAISEKGKDHQICGDYVHNEILARFAPRYGCAKCNTTVPCEHRIP